MRNSTLLHGKVNDAMKKVSLRGGRIFALMMLLLSLTLGAKANPVGMNQTRDYLTVYDGSVTNSYVPVYGFYTDAYLKCEYIMPAAELTEMADSDINAVTYYLSNLAAADWGAAYFQVFMKEVDSTTINTYQGMDGATLVYEGPLDGTQAEMNITFTTPYHYYGGNLLVGIYNVEQGTYKSCSFYGESVSGASVQGYSYNSLDEVTCNQRNFLPKTTFYYSGGVLGANLVTTPNPIDLGYRPNGAWMRPMEVNIFNYGTETTINNVAVTNNSYFQLGLESVSVPFVLGHNAGFDVNLSTVGSASGVVNGNLVVNYGDNEVTLFDVSAMAYTPVSPDVWEQAQLVNTFPFTATLNANSVPLYDNYRLPPASISDGADAVYKLVFTEDTYLNASVTSGENGKVALFTEDFNGVGGPDFGNSYTGPQIGSNNAPFTAMIGDVNSTTTSTYFPFHTLWNYSLGETLFLASELEVAGVTTAPMTSLSWFVSSMTTTTPQNGINIWMANVSDTELTATSHITSGMSLVYTGTDVLPVAGQWNEFVFNVGSFAWDGHSNVLIVCQRINGSWQGSISWQTHNPGFTAMSYLYGDNDIYDALTTSYDMNTSSTNRANVIMKGGNRSNRDEFTCNFEGGMLGWTTIDADGDGNNWFHSSNSLTESGYDYTGYGHNSSDGFMVSASYTDVTYDSYAADNYLVSPQKYTLEDNASLNFYFDYGSDSYPDYFEVCVATANNPSANDFTSVWNVNMRGNSEKASIRHNGNRYMNWRNVNVNLSAYAGQQVWIAFHHQDYDEYEVWIDDVTINSSGGGSNGTIIDLTVTPGTYFLVASSTSDEFTVEINTDEVPCPELAINPRPADAAMEVNTSALLSWNLDSRATEYRLMFGTTYYCEDTLVDWTNGLSERYFVTGLNNNTNYFWRIDQRNSSCPEGVLGQVWGFTTHLNVPLNLYADSFILQGEDLTLYWDAPNDRSFQYYNIYQDGELIGSTYDTYYTVSDLSYNINPGYYFNVTAVYDEGESTFSNTCLVRVTGEGTIEGYVYEQDGVTPIHGARVEFNGSGQIGGSYWYYYYTDENGHYSFNMVAGSYNGIATHAGYQAAQHGSFTIAYNETTSDINFIMDELFNPVSEVVAEYYPDTNDPNSPYVKVYWGTNTNSWLYYDDGINLDAIGLTNGGSFYWGVMFPAGSYVGSSLTKVSMYDYSAHTGNFMIYQGGTTAPGTLLYTQAYSCTGSGDFVEWTLNTPVGLDPTQTLWIVMNNNDGQYVAAACANTGDANGRWISIDGAAWDDVAGYGLDYTWMIRGFVSNGSSKGETLMVDNRTNSNQQQAEGIQTPHNGSSDGVFSTASNVTPHNVGTPVAIDMEEFNRSFQYYRVYRTEAYNDGPYTFENTEVIATELQDTLYIDVSWSDVEMGVYKWGVSCVYEGNRGEEMEGPISWGEPVGINNTEPTRATLDYDFDDSSTQGWTTIDADGDGYDWVLGSNIGGVYLASGASLAGSGHNASNDMMCSGSYSNATSQAISPDNYLVSPQVVLGGSITFWACAQDASYAAEHFAVAVSTTDNTSASAFTNVQEWTMTAKGVSNVMSYGRGGNTRAQGNWYQYTVDLSAYSGYGYVAIRHFNCTDMFILDIDDITIVEGDNLQESRESEIVWSNGLDKDMYLMNNEVNITVMLNSGDSPAGTTVRFTNLNPREQQLHPMADIILDGTGYYAWDSFRRGDYVVTVSKEGYSIINTNVSIWDATSLSYMLEEMIPVVSDLYVSSTGWAMWNYTSGDSFSFGFEEGLPEGWTIIDANGDGYTWVLTSDIPATWTYYASLTLDWYHDGSNAICSGSYINGVGALSPDEYLISPLVNLTNTSQLSFWVAATDANYAADHFGVFVSTTGTNPSDFTSVQEWTLTAKSEGKAGGSASRDGRGSRLATWYNYTVDLSSYAGQAYIAFRHFNCTDQYIMCLDDIELTFSGDRDRHLEYSQVVLTDVQDNVLFSGNTTDPFIQLPVDDLVEGETYRCKVASIYSTGMTGWSEVDWVYQACDNYEGANSIFATTTDEGNLISWEFLGNMSGLSNNLSANAHLLCLDDATQSYAANINAGTGEVGPDYGCLYSTPNPSWYYMKIDNPGNIDVYMHSEPSVDIDFCCWGPFDNPVSPCPDGLTSDKIVDCSYSASWNETCHIPETAQSGEYYILLLTNYSNQVCDFYFEKQDGTGTTVCEDYAIGTMIFRDGEWLGLSSESSYLDEGETGNHQYTIRMVYGGPAVCPGNNIYYSMSCPQTAFMGETYQITATASPSEGGSIVGAGIYGEGVTCTLTATANEGYTFLNWTKDGIIVSTEASYSFTVSEDAAYVANFISDTDHWSVDIHQYPYNMSVTGIIRINGVEQAVPTLEIGAFCGEECRGAQRLTYFPQVDRYLVFFTLYGDAGDVMSFRLYDHSIGEELDLSCSSTISFVPDGFIGTAFDPYVFNFGNTTMVEQVSTFSEGYNWWSTYIEQEGIDGLGMLQEGLGDNGVSIRSQASGYTDYYAGYGWYGSLSSINNESSYRVITNAPCTVTMTGDAAMPSQHPITLGQGWTWIGYVPSTAMSVNAAMANVNAVAGDKVKSQQGYADYYEGYGWYGSLNTIEPGMGLMYYSTNGSPVTFTYPDGNKGGELKKNITAENNHWVPNVHAYPDNMTVMAVIELDGVEVTSDNYELAAFAANGECRGSVKLMYAEPLHRHVAFLTISGKDAAELSFRLYNTETDMGYYDAEESLDFVANAIVGEANDLYVVHFRGTTSMDEFASRVKVYPNPVNAGEQFSIGMNIDARLPIRVEIINALGAVVSVETSTQAPASIVAPVTAGVYTLRITVEGKGTVVRKLVVK